MISNLNSESLKEINKLISLLNKHGICKDCGQMYSHDIDKPFAHCNCKTSEWYKLTPYMQLEKLIKELRETKVKGRPENGTPPYNLGL